MQKREMKQYNQQAKILKALAHPTRLFIVHELTNRELCVNEITDMVGVDISTISKHLSLLRDVGIIGFEKRGKSVYYSLKTPCVLNFFQCIMEVQKTNFKEQFSAMQ